jgi:hypothetical protein
VRVFQPAQVRTSRTHLWCRFPNLHVQVGDPHMNSTKT